MPTFSDLSRAAFCPRQLYYARREDDREPPPETRERIDLAYEYDRLIDASDPELRRLPIDRRPAEYRRNLDRLRDLGDWEELVDPTDRRAFLEGRDCRGVAHKILCGADGEPPVPTVVSPGTPPPEGVWEPQTVRAVAIAKALAWERDREVPCALVEYPVVGIVREVPLTTRRKAAYRRAVRTVRSLDGPPPRRNDARCDACDYREECGVATRSLRSKLGL